MKGVKWCDANESSEGSGALQVANGDMGVSGEPLHWGYNHGATAHILFTGLARAADAWTTK